MGEPSTAPGRVEGGGQLVLSFEQCFNLFCSFSLLFAFVVGGLGFEFCVFVAGWRHALRSEWPFIIIIINRGKYCKKLIKKQWAYVIRLCTMSYYRASSGRHDQQG